MLRDLPDGKDMAPQAVLDALLALYSDLPAAAQQEARDRLALDVFFLVLRDAGRECAPIAAADDLVEGRAEGRQAEDHHDDHGGELADIAKVDLDAVDRACS